MMRNVHTIEGGDADSFRKAQRRVLNKKASSRILDFGRPKRSRKRDVPQFSNPGLAAANDSP